MSVVRPAMQTYVLSLLVLGLAGLSSLAALLDTQPESTSIFKRALVVKGGAGRKIYGGKYAKANNYPFQVYVRTFLDEDHKEFCGGAIIGTRHVLTAAHCVNMPRIMKVCAIVGHEHRFHKQTTKFTVVRKHFYEKKSNEKVTADIAVLMVDRPIPIGRANIQQIKLVGKAPIKINTTCSISGWGETDDEWSDPNLLQQAKVPLVDHGICRKAYPLSPPDDLLCAGFYGVGGADSCKGDSGGPLVCNGLLTGIVKSGKGCGLPEYPGTYTNVAYYWRWIKQMMVQDMNQESKGRNKTRYANVC